MDLRHNGPAPPRATGASAALDRSREHGACAKRMLRGEQRRCDECACTHAFGAGKCMTAPRACTFWAWAGAGAVAHRVRERRHAHCRRVHTVRAVASGRTGAMAQAGASASRYRRNCSCALRCHARLLVHGARGSRPPPLCDWITPVHVGASSSREPRAPREGGAGGRARGGGPFCWLPWLSFSRDCNRRCK